MRRFCAQYRSKHAGGPWKGCQPHHQWQRKTSLIRILSPKKESSILLLWVRWHSSKRRHSCSLVVLLTASLMGASHHHLSSVPYHARYEMIPTILYGSNKRLSISQCNAAPIVKRNLKETLQPKPTCRGKRCDQSPMYKLIKWEEWGVSTMWLKPVYLRTKFGFSDIHIHAVNVSGTTFQLRLHTFVSHFFLSTTFISGFEVDPVFTFVTSF